MSVVGQGALQHFDVWHIESRGGRTLCTNTAESISHVTQAGGDPHAWTADPGFPLQYT